MNLGFDFVIFSVVFLSALVPIYFFRKKIFKRFYKPSDFELFIVAVKRYMMVNHPRISVNYAIVEQTSEEENPKTRQILIVEDLIGQFTTFEMSISTQESINKDLIWKTYDADSMPIKDRLPKDWQRRKTATCSRDKNRCKRCGTKLETSDAQIYFINKIEDGGTYHFENLLTTCSDCNRILNSDDLGKTAKSLNITETLMSKILYK